MVVVQREEESEESSTAALEAHLHNLPIMQEPLIDDPVHTHMANMKLQDLLSLST